MPYDLEDADYDYSSVEVVPLSFYDSFYYFMLILLIIGIYTFYKRNLSFNKVRNLSPKKYLPYIFSVFYVSGAIAFVAYLPMVFLFKADINFSIGFFCAIFSIRIFSDIKARKPKDIEL